MKYIIIFLLLISIDNCLSEKETKDKDKRCLFDKKTKENTCKYKKVKDLFNF